MKALEDEQTQRNGMVVIGYYEGLVKATSQLTQFSGLGGPLLVSAIPFRPASFHFCCCGSEYAILKPFVSFIQMVSGEDVRLRFRSHIGKWFCLFFWAGGEISSI